MKRRKIVLIGAGSSVFTQGLAADLIMTKDLGKWEVALVDIDPGTLTAITGLVKRMIESKGADIPVYSSTERKEVLAGADVVVATIAVGGRRAWEKDVFIPRQYGIYQPVGDTTMPGGISRALRMIPVMLEVAADIQRLCPNALFINYSNPMTAICQAIRSELGLAVVGLCHGVFHVEQHIGRLLGIPSGDVRSLGAGLNHLTFLYDVRHQGESLLDRLRESYQAEMKGDRPYGGAGRFLEEGGTEEARPRFRDNQFTWELFVEHGAVPAVLDRHVVEFFPERFGSGAYYGKRLGVDAFTFEGVIAHGDRTFQEMTEQAAGRAPMDDKLFHRSEGEHEQLMEILRSLYLDERRVFSVNLPNAGSVPGLPDDSVLELPAVAAGKGLLNIVLPDFPDALKEILLRRIAVVDATVRAALTGERQAFIEALLLDGSVSDGATAARLADDLLRAHKEHLPRFFVPS